MLPIYLKNKNVFSRILVVCGVVILIAFICGTLLRYYSYQDDHVLTIAFLDVGQGDAIYIRGPNGKSVLFDGGSDSRVLQKLSAVMPFTDSDISMLVVTNPDKDHIGGFIPILRRYRVGIVLEPGTHSPSATYATLEAVIDESGRKHGTKKLLARAGMNFDLGEGAHLEILFPDRDVSKLKTNDGSIVAKLSFASTSVMLMGDAPQATEKYLVTLDTLRLIDIQADILKVGHHGSRTSTNSEFVARVRPTWGIISAGLNNRYKHPHQETLDTLSRFGVTILKTFEKGTILFRSDGKHFFKPVTVI